MATKNKIPFFSKLPMAKNDFFSSSSTGLTEDKLSTVYLNVTNNDSGGKTKALWSLDNGHNTSNLLTKDTARTEATSSDHSANGAKIWITLDGKVGYDPSTLSPEFKAQLDGLNDGQYLTDTFTYAIRLSDGTLSWATATVQFQGVTDDTLPPTLTITMDDKALAAGETSLVTFTFSEAIATTGPNAFDISKIQVQNGTLLNGGSSTLQHIGLDSNGHDIWTATFTPNANVIDTTNTISVTGSSYADIAGNTGTNSNVLNYVIYTQPTGVPTILGSDVSNVHDNLTGTTGDDIIDARAGADAVHAGAGNDVVIGGTGNDYLFGEGGNDIIFGDRPDGLGTPGDDLLSGGAGNNVLIGGGGADTFRFSSDGGNDAIIDFHDGNGVAGVGDRLDIRAMFTDANNPDETLYSLQGSSTFKNGGGNVVDYYLSTHMVQDGNDVVIYLPDESHTIRIMDTLVTNIDHTDFL